MTAFIPFLSSEKGWSITDLSMSISISLWVYAIGNFITGRLIDTIGGKRVVTIGSICLMLGFGLLSRVDELWQLYLVHGVLLGMAASMTLTVTTQSVGRKWFVKKSGLVGGLLIASFSVSQALLMPVIMKSTEVLSWQTTSLICVSFGMIILFFALFVIKDTPESIGLRPYGAERGIAETSAKIEAETEMTPGQAYRTVSFWVLVLGFGLVGTPVQGFFAHIVQWAISLGADSATAGLIVTITSVPAIAGKIIWGWAGDRFGKRKIMILGSTICALSMLAGWLWASDVLTLAIVCVLFGISYGSLSLHAPYMGDIFGRASIGTVFGAAMVAHGVLGGIGPLLWGRIFDSTGAYSLACLISAGFYALVVICYIVARPVVTK